MALTIKQQRFVDEYLIDLNGAAAYKRAGYKATGHVAEAAASRLLKNPHVKEAIATMQAARARRCEITADAVVAELGRVAFSSMKQFAEWGPDGVKLLPSEGLSDDVAVCVAELSQTVTKDGGSVRFKLHSKTAALEMLARHIGMFTDRLEVKRTITSVESLTDEELDIIIATGKHPQE